MKKYLFGLTMVTAPFILGCSEETITEQIQPEEVEVSLSYLFMESGSMTQSSSNVYSEFYAMTKSGSTAYSDFYEKYIKTKQLTPKNFSLVFTNKETGATATINGNWEENHSFRLLAGEYEVTGTSQPESNTCIDTLWLSFDEDVTITAETESINLTAQYDSYMLLFDKGDKDYVRYQHSVYNGTETIELDVVDDIYYAFIHSLLGGTSYWDRITISRSGKYSYIYLDDIPFEKGKYYYFNDISNTFDIPQMEEGN